MMGSLADYFRTFFITAHCVLEERELRRAISFDLPPASSILEKADLRAAEAYADMMVRRRRYSHPEILWGVSLWNSYKFQHLMLQWLLRRLVWTRDKSNQRKDFFDSPEPTKGIPPNSTFLLISGITPSRRLSFQSHSSTVHPPSRCSLVTTHDRPEA